MKNIINLAFIIVFLVSCQEKEDTPPVKHGDWLDRKSETTNFNDYNLGKTYLPVYSHIYHIHEHKTFDLAITVSIRNVSITDSLYILKVDYYNTNGDNIRQYLNHPIFLKPMETIEIVISEQDKEGGSGANFVFDWAIENEKNPPLFEAVMISTYGQQGLSFTTRGVRIFE